MYLSVHQMLVTGRDGVLSNANKKRSPIILRRDDEPLSPLILVGKSLLVGVGACRGRCLMRRSATGGRCHNSRIAAAKIMSLRSVHLRVQTQIKTCPLQRQIIMYSRSFKTGGKFCCTNVSFAATKRELWRIRGSNSRWSCCWF